MSTADDYDRTNDPPNLPPGDRVPDGEGSSLLDAAGQLSGDSMSTERAETELYAMEATLEEAILERLRGLDVQKVVLFGSHAWGRPGPDSDMDLLVVLDDEDVPKTSAEHGRLRQRVARHLRDIEREVPIDLIVHTLPMHEEFLNRNSMFARKVTSQGRILYEKSD